VLFQTLKTSAGVIVIGGVGSLLFEENTVSNITFSGDGVLIFSNGTNTQNATVSLINTNFNNLNGTDLNGTVLRIAGVVSTVLVTGCSVGPSVIGGNGGAFYLTKCTTVITSTKFSGCSTGLNGNGGAVYFGEGALFSLRNLTIGNCSAFYGGGLFIISEETSGKMINETNFINNSVQMGGNGNDIADNSSVGGSIYSSSTVINSLSNSTNSSTVSNFYLIALSARYDCLLSVAGCSFDVMYVTINGNDHNECGSQQSPCKTVTQAANNMYADDDSEGGISVGPGDYTSTVVVAVSITMFVHSNTTTRPVLSLVSPPAGFDYIKFFFFFLFRRELYFFFLCPGTSSMIIVGSNGTFSTNSISFVYNVLPSGNLRLFTTGAINSLLTITNCTFTVNGTSAVVPLSVISHSGGRIFIMETTFSGFSLNGQTLIAYSGFHFSFYFILFYFIFFLIV
jgi:hypothetical protein